MIVVTIARFPLVVGGLLGTALLVVGLVRAGSTVGAGAVAWWVATVAGLVLLVVEGRWLGRTRGRLVGWHAVGFVAWESLGDVRIPWSAVREIRWSGPVPGLRQVDLPDARFLLVELDPGQPLDLDDAQRRRLARVRDRAGADVAIALAMADAHDVDVVEPFVAAALAGGARMTWPPAERRFRDLLSRATRRRLDDGLAARIPELELGDR